MDSKLLVDTIHKSKHTSHQHLTKRFKKMLPNQIVYILNFFDVFGYNSGLSQIPSNISVTYIIKLLHISIAIFCMWCISHLITEYYSFLPPVEAITETMQYSTALCTYLLFIFDSIVNRGANQRFWNILKQVIEDSNKRYEFSLKNYIKKLTIYGIKVVLILIIRISEDPFINIKIDAAYEILFRICEIRMFYSLFCFEIVYIQLEIIERECKEIVYRNITIVNNIN